jgi:crotonobetainyl-CoA:carnitine CoA-transferase CaiB-like acyl-CoA transferase
MTQSSLDGSGAATMLLSPYRVLDLTDHRGLLCGKILADLGAGVIQIEPPGGSPARKLGPFYHDEAEPEKSLFWWSYAANKRGITLDIESAAGRGLLLKLVEDADFLIESFSPGYMEGLGLGYADLAKTNPGLVMVSISPFGMNGPYAGFKAPDIVGTAMSGFMWLTGDSDRPPVRVSFPHFYLHGAAAGATGAMLAHAHRALTGEGQHVDVSCQQAVARTLAHAPQHWDVEGNILTRNGVFRQTAGDSLVRTSWPCKDGFINYSPGGGGAGVAASTRALLAWMNQEGLGDEYLESVDWEELGYGQMRAEIMDKAVEPLIRFFATHTRDELVAGSVEKRILLFPVSTQEDILAHPQLEARGYFQELEHPELGITATYPGPFIKDNDRDNESQRVGIRRRPPLIGEHNSQVYREGLGMSDAELSDLKAGGVI